ncbi:hypothetical protein BD770DRAFT_205183 [Pilaira anomala]|nr:hypothetical protein BD770DRAFT_205183 [Pilaira anomala]
MKQEDINTYDGIILRRSPRIKTSLRLDSIVKQEEEEIDSIVKQEEEEMNSIFKQEEEEIEVKIPGKRTLRSQMSNVSTHSKKMEPSNSLQGQKDHNRYCKTCNYTYDTVDLYLYHKMQIHKDQIPANYCALCSKQYVSITSLRNHIKSLHPTFNNSKPHKSSHPKTSPASKHTDFYCSVCNRKYTNKLRHMETVHNISSQPKKSKILYPDRTLDTNDPNNYCNVCDFKYKTRCSYLVHLMLVHFVYARSNYSSPSSEKPIIALETLYCNVCCIKFNRTTSYKLHLRNVHGLSETHKEGYIVRPRNKPDINDANNYCRVCRRKSVNKVFYRKHLLHVHWIQSPQSEISKPDMNDPNNYCSVCDMKFHQKSGYTTHLLRNHPELHPQFKQKAEPKYETPVIDFKNNFCNVCQRTYKSNVYKLHLKYRHNISVFIPKSICRNPDIKPVADDPNNYCRCCERTYSSNSSYRTHLNNIHKISRKELNHVRTYVRRNIIAPTTENSNNYCNACDKSLKTRSTYLGHMSVIHNIKFPKRRPGRSKNKSIKDIKEDDDYEIKKKKKKKVV